ncbi:Lrp/AsnC family transcriptional regulator [Ruminococcaceae bacterium OttesenSCG-928-A11]|nr:Lrp/AsnC family transcriptional regulator [Ruminococcaceae bacterium OttesenSCG-928-A11]
MPVKTNDYDLIDQQIIEMLVNNSRVSLIEIAEKVGLSRVAVKNRIDALERGGVIEQYTIIINPEKVGRNVSVFFEIEVNPAHLHQVMEALVKEDAITDAYLMTGATKLHVHAVLEMNQDLERFMLDKLYTLPGIEKVCSDMIVSRFKTRKGIRV